MENLRISHQTLQEFLDAPFGIPNKQKQLQYETKYQNYKKTNKIKIEAYIEFEENYFVHVKVPSESQKGASYYDVVIQFFTSDEKLKSQLNVENYYVQFFSNSPGFVYKYAALYKLQGYLIESLYEKFEPGTLDILPDKANASYELYFDSSIYYACRFLLDNKLFVLGKLSMKISKIRSWDRFLDNIQDTETVNIGRDVNAIEKKLKKEIEIDTKLSEQQETKLKKNPTIAKQLTNRKEGKKARKTTAKDSSGLKIITAKKSTGKVSNKHILPQKKKRSTFTTRKGR